MKGPSVVCIKEMEMGAFLNESNGVSTAQI